MDGKELELPAGPRSCCWPCCWRRCCPAFGAALALACRPAWPPTRSISRSTARSGSAPAIAAGIAAILRRWSASAPCRRRAAGLPWLREAVVHRLAWAARARSRRSRRSRPAAHVPGRNRRLAAGQSAAAASARTGLRRRIPLDLYAYERPERLRRFDQRERLLILLDRDRPAGRALSASSRGLAVSGRSGPRPGAPAGPIRRAVISPSWSGRPPASGSPTASTSPSRAAVRPRAAASHLSGVPSAPLGRCGPCAICAQSLVIVLRERPRWSSPPAPTSPCRSASWPGCSAPGSCSSRPRASWHRRWPGGWSIRSPTCSSSSGRRSCGPSRAPCCASGPLL